MTVRNGRDGDEEMAATTGFQLAAPSLNFADG